MRGFICTVIFLISSTYAYADRYGFDENYHGDSSGKTGWFLFIVLLIYVIYQEVKKN